MNAIKAFEAAARSGSFTLAADELSVTASAVSRHISNLEDYLQVPLFWRRHNEVGLTTDGDLFAQRVAAALSIIEDESRRITQRANSRQLHVHSVPTFATRWLVPRLHLFNERHPKIELLLTTSLGEINTVEEYYGVAFHAGTTFTATPHSHILFETEVQVVCSPDYAADHNLADNIAAVRNCTLLHSVNRLTHWRQWLVAAGLDPRFGEAGPKFSNSALMYEAAAYGMGLSCADVRFVKSDLERGRLIAPFDLVVPTSDFFMMTVDPIKADLHTVKAFTDWLLEEVAEEEATMRAGR